MRKYTLIPRALLILLGTVLCLTLVPVAILARVIDRLHDYAMDASTDALDRINAELEAYNRKGKKKCE